MGLRKDTIKKRNERLGQKRINSKGEEGEIIGFEGNSSTQLIVRMNNGHICKTQWEWFDQGTFYYNHRVDRIGSGNYNCQDEYMRIIAYRSEKDIDVQFDETKYIYEHCRYGAFCTGKIKDPLYPSILGLGCIGVGEFNCRSEYKGLNIYSYWEGMIERVYIPRKNGIAKGYEECEVDKEWFNLQNFAKWFIENAYVIPNQKMQLDKDLLIKNNKIYGPETCCILPREINNLLIKRGNDRGPYPIGVTKGQYNKYTAQLSRKRLGRINSNFDTPEEAFAFYKQEKEKYIKYVADIYKDQIPQKIYDALYAYEVEITD